MPMRPSLILSGLVAAGLVAAVPAYAQRGTQVGTLSCDVSPGIGFIIGSSKALNCVFQTRRGAFQYAGTVNRLGLDIGITAGGRLVWAVFAPSTQFAANALAGEYVGASAEATAGVGVGANALVGGNNRTLSLQPLSVQGQAGVSLAAGVASMTLEPVAPAERPRRSRR